jgi:hypothetical protein
MKHAIEMGFGAMIHITKFHKNWFGYSKVDERGYTDTQTAKGSHYPTFISQNKESRLIITI